MDRSSSTRGLGRSPAADAGSSATLRIRRRPTGEPPPLCERGDTLVLTAQAVPDATMLPCLQGFPVGWSSGGYDAQSGSVRFWMDSDRAGAHAVEIELVRSCDTSSATTLPADQAMEGVSRFTTEESTDPPAGRRYFTFDGGCVSLRYRFQAGTDAGLLAEVENALVLLPRSLLVAKMQERGIVLCGAAAPPCD